MQNQVFGVGRKASLGMIYSENVDNLALLQVTVIIRKL